MNRNNSSAARSVPDLIRQHESNVTASNTEDKFRRSKRWFSFQNISTRYDQPNATGQGHSAMAVKLGDFAKTDDTYSNSYLQESDVHKKNLSPNKLKQSMKNIAAQLSPSTLHEENEYPHEHDVESEGVGEEVDTADKKHHGQPDGTPGLGTHRSTGSLDHLATHERRRSAPGRPRSESSSGVTGSQISLPETGPNRVQEKVRSYIRQQSSSVSEATRYVKRPSRLQSESDLQRVFIESKPKSKSEKKLKDTELTICLPFPDGQSFPSIECSSLASPLPDIYQSQKIEIAAATKSRLKLHNDNNTKTRSRRFDNAKRTLQDNGIVFIKAYPGDGSTHLSLDILLAFENYRPFILAKPSEFQICLQGETAAIFLVDDAFGRTECNKSRNDKWIQYIDRNRQGIEDGRIKIVFVVKSTVADKCSDILDSYPASLIDLLDQENQRSVTEIVELLRTMTSQSVALDESQLNDYAKHVWPIGIPKRVSEFLREKAADADEFFNTPSTDLMKMVESLNKHSQSKLVTLTLILLSKENAINDGNIDTVFGALQAKSIPRSTLAHLHSKIASSKPKEKWLRLLQKIIQWDRNETMSLRRNARDLLGTLLKMNTKGYYALAAASVETAVLLVIGRRFTVEVLDYCNDAFFNRFVFTDCTEDGPGLILPLHDSKACVLAAQRLKDIILEERVEEAVQHPLLRDALFASLFFKTIKKEPCLTRKILLSRDKISGKTIVSIGFETVYDKFVDGNPETFGGTILCHPKWLEIREHQTEWTGVQEDSAIQTCCRYRLEDTFFKICTRLDLFHKVGKECLLLSIESGAYRIVECLLGRIRSGLTLPDLGEALIKACVVYCEGNCQTSNRFRIIKALLELIPFDFECRGVESIVHYAGRTGNGRLFVLVDMFGGNINLPNAVNETCLHVAARFNQYQLAKFALGRGADPTQQDIEGKYAVHVAADCESVNEVLQVICAQDREFVEVKDSRGRRPIHFASKRGNIENIEYLCCVGASLDVIDDRGQTPLHYSSTISSLATEMLLKYGASTNMPDKNGDTPIELACRTGNLESLKHILEFQYSKSPKCLFIAVESKKRDITEVLLEHEFNVNSKNLRGITLLDCAMKYDSSLVDLLLRYNIDVGVPSGGIYPIQVAVQKNDLRLFKSLSDAGADVTHVHETNGDTILHIAVKHSASDDMIRAILNSGHPFVNKENTNSETALQMAIVRARASTVCMLLEYGADTLKQNRSGQTALQLAQQCEQGGKRRHRIQYQQINALLAAGSQC